MTDVQGKKFINLTGLHLFWQNVIKPKFDSLAAAVDNHGTQLSTLSADKADKSRFDNFNGVVGTTIEDTIASIQAAAGISGLKVNNTGNTLITVKANGNASSEQQHDGVVIISIDETALNTKIGDIEGAIDGIEGDISDLNTNKADSSVVSELQGTVATLATKDELAGEVSGLNQKINGKADSIDVTELQGTVATLATKDELAGEVSGLNQKIDGKADSSKVSELDQAVKNLGDAVALKAAQADLNTLSQTVATLGTDLDTAEDKIATAEGKITAAEGRITTAEGKITAAEGKITDLENAVDALSSATDFVGVTTTELTDGDETNPIKINGQDYSAVKGDIVICGNKEFIFDGGKWVELGDTTALAQDVETLKTAAETNKNEALSNDDVTAAFNAGWNPQPAQ